MSNPKIKTVLIPKMKPDFMWRDFFFAVLKRAKILRKKGYRISVNAFYVNKTDHKKLADLADDVWETFNYSPCTRKGVKSGTVEICVDQLWEKM